MHFPNKKDLCRFLYEKKLHIRLVRMKRLICRDEAPSSFRTINKRNSVFQPHSRLSHRSDWWKAFQKNLVVEVMINIFFPFSLQKNCLFVENEIIVSKPCLVFYIMVPEYAEGGLVGQTIITERKKCQFPPYCRKAPKSFENIQIIVIQKCCNQRYLILIGLLLTKLCDNNKKWSSLEETKSKNLLAILISYNFLIGIFRKKTVSFGSTDVAPIADLEGNRVFYNL